MDLGLKDKVALVAAASRGLGKAVAREFGREGAHVAICARGEDALRATALEIAVDTWGEVFPVVADVTEPEDIQRLVSAVEEHFGQIDILVNNAGGPPTGTFVDFDDEAWEAALRLNLMSTIRLCRAVLSGMRTRHWGRIVNITSVSVKQPMDGFILSSAARSGVVGMAKTLANECAAEGITVNNVCPGYTLTDRVKSLAEGRAVREGKSVREVVDEYAADIPARRLGHPEELAALVAFLASERAAYITGATIQVDGGYVRSLL
jgi:3-oxoacyl-[acyl-carrier protein] reductase